MPVGRVKTIFSFFLFLCYTFTYFNKRTIKGNHTKPWDIDEDGMRPSSYTMAENWGGQINFMIPLDREGLNRCRSIAKRQEEKMRLDY